MSDPLARGRDARRGVRRGARRLVPRRTSAGGFAAGAATALSLPPWGWWPLAFAGVATWNVLAARIPGRAARCRLAWWFTAGWLGLGMAWMWFLSAPGYLAAVCVFAAYHAVAEALVPGDARSAYVRPAAHVLAEALRLAWPFGGVPLATLAIGQAGGPLLAVARVGGVLLLTWLVLQIGSLLAAAVGPVRPAAAVPAAARLGRSLLAAAVGRVRRPARPALVAGAVAGGVLLAVLAAAWVSPTGATGAAGTLRVAAVQGGGPQGTRAIHSDARKVFERHLAATRTITAGSVDLVVWPENVINVPVLATSTELAEVATEARRLGVPFVAGVTDDAADPAYFRNAQVVITPDGTVVDRYDKVVRVPFGEYMPFRSLLHAFGAPTDLVPRDAVAGDGPAVLRLPDGTRLATVISWEVYFARRVADGVDHGGEVIVNPTNGSSYTWTILQSQQVASSRLRAVEQGRWLVQVSPTGFSEFVSPSGDVSQRTAISQARVIVGIVERFSGRTWYGRFGDLPWILGAAVVVVVCLVPLVPRTPARRTRQPD